MKKETYDVAVWIVLDCKARKLPLNYAVKFLSERNFSSEDLKLILEDAMRLEQELLKLN